MNSTLIIDADDTLWENNIFYEDALDRQRDVEAALRTAYEIRYMSRVVPTRSRAKNARWSRRS